MTDARMKDLYPYQQTQVRVGKNAPHVFSFDEQGLGKTLQVLKAIVDENRFPCLITCPTTNVYTWANEIKKWFPSKSVVIETTSNSGLIVNEYFKDHNRFFIIAHPAFARANEDCKNYNPVMESIKYLPFKAGVIDECHYFRNPDTLKTQALLETIETESIDKWYFLSGTPVVNSAADLYPLAALSGSKIRREEFDYHFSHSRYNNRTGAVEYYGLRNTRDLDTVLNGALFRRTAKQIKTELPEKVIQTEVLIMSPRQRKYYSQLLTTNRVEIEGNTKLSVGAKIAMFTRLRQLCTEPSSVLEVENIPSIKREATRQILENSHGKSIVFSSFNKTLDAIGFELSKIGITSVKLTGASVPDVEMRQIIIDNFNSTDTHQVLLMNMQIATGLSISGGEGDADTVRTVIVTDRWWNEVVTDQAVARAIRVDSKAPFVNIYYLSCHDSIDSFIFGKNVSKSRVANAFLHYVRTGENPDSEDDEKFVRGIKFETVENS